MNTANKLTIARVLMVPLFVLLFYLQFPGHYLLSMLVFIAASITDAVDGKMARKYNLITDFGKFLDPLADKVLVITAMACLLQQRYLNIIPFLLIIAREFMVDALRLVVAGKGTVVPAGFAGKLKTAFTMVAIIAELLFLTIYWDCCGYLGIGVGVPEAFWGGIQIFLSVLFWIAAILTVYSGVKYLVAYWKDINPNQ
ncbi:MAG: CDP-diacylglycerol--glycerol-3-phosphate 3-phosphatidyltransferase [Oscillospiraceae bacterium]|nr:CDP-diacylglycerol--glycerol-3-phosphate 3-phosphatidyltransferase [Oscillospiraceae bacterium]